MLLDTFDPRSQKQFPTTVKNIVSARHRAMRYFISDEVVVKVAGLVKDYPNFLVHNYQFALPPYPCTYIEFNVDLFLKELGAPTSADLAEHATSRDQNLGYLIDGSRISVLANGISGSEMTYKHEVGASMINYTMGDVHNPGSKMIYFNDMTDQLPDRLKTFIKSRREIEVAFFFGSTFTNERARWTPEIVHDLTSRFHVWIDGTVAKNTKNGEEVADILREGSVGDVRNMLAMLLWINQPKLVEFERVGAHRGWYNHRNIAYAAHHVVKLRHGLTTRKIMRALQGDRRTPRRHEVAAFWRNFNKHPGCIHEWPIYPDENGHWTCPRCGQWRTRVQDHMRGDASLGFVTKQYKVG